MTHLKVLEHYVSVQGEGPQVGVPTQFVRFAGCNLRCPGWPCDTQHAIRPDLYIGKYWKADPYDLYQAIKRTAIGNICFTGGEPFMQNQEYLKKLTTELDHDGFTCEFFTNGTITIPEWAMHHAIIMMDWKLAGSGEMYSHREVRKENLKRLPVGHGVKFVVVDKDDLDEAALLTEEWADIKATLWVGAAWGRITDAEVIDYLLKNKLPWRLNVQVHKHIWDPEAIGV